VADKDDELRDHLNILVQEKIETVAVMVALSFGAFTILILLENKHWDNILSAGGFCLSPTGLYF
jgi:hypothetical protein